MPTRTLLPAARILALLLIATVVGSIHFPSPGSAAEVAGRYFAEGVLPREVVLYPDGTADVDVWPGWSTGEVARWSASSIDGERRVRLVTTLPGLQGTFEYLLRQVGIDLLDDDSNVWRRVPTQGRER